MSLNNRQFSFWAKNEFNVLLEGKHGVGKTALVRACFDEQFGELGVDWLYFSAATMDPWVDFIGVPREETDEDGVTYLGLVRPEMFAKDKVKAIFVDEYNRAPKKVRNALMELCQFGSINGHAFPNLKVIWAAINPDDGNYDTEGMDPAQRDRFHIQVAVPYKPDPAYFAKKFGAHYAEAAIAWWKQLPPEIKEAVTPRRLDYALDIYKKGGELRGFVLPEKSGVDKLIEDLATGPAEREFREILSASNHGRMQRFLQDENNYSACEKEITKNQEALAFCFPLLSDERQMTLMAKEKKIEGYVFANPGPYGTLIEKLAQNPINADLAKKAETILNAKSRHSRSAAAANDPFADSLTNVNAYSAEVARTSLAINPNLDSNAMIHGATREVSSIDPQTVKDTSSTPDKKAIINDDLRQCVHYNMSVSEATYAFQVLNYISARCHGSTIMQCDDIVEIINTLVMAMRSHNPDFGVDETCEIAPHLMARIVPTIIKAIDGGGHRWSSRDFVFQTAV